MNLVRAELLKIRTTRMWWGLLIGAVVFAALAASISAAVAGSAQAGAPGQNPAMTFQLDDPAMLRSIYSQGFSGAYLFAMILGIVGMTGEYRHQTITPTFLATPRRGRVVLAKIVTYAGMGVFYGVVATVAAVAAGGVVILFRGYDLGLTGNAVPQTLALCILAVAVWAVFGLGLGTLIKNQIAAIMVAVGSIFVVETLITLGLNYLEAGEVAQFLPSSASSAIVQPIDQGIDLLPWWGGALVLTLYGLVFAGIGAALTMHRDIT